MNHKVVAIAYPGFLLGCTAVYFLVERGVALDISPLMLSGLRLLLAGIVLVATAKLLGVEFKPALRKLWRYAVVGLFTMALPHGLLFIGMKSTQVNENAAAFIEATIPGIVLVYLVAGKHRVEWQPFVLVFTALLGLAMFLDVNPFAAGFAGDDPSVLLVLLSAVVTGIGIVLSDVLLPSKAKGWNAKLRESITTAALTTFCASIFTLAYIPIFTDEALVVASNAWGYIVALAIFGTCLSWVTFFMLLGEDIVLACSAVVAIPVVAALASTAGLGAILNARELASALIVVFSLSAIIYVKVMRQPA